MKLTHHVTKHWYILPWKPCWTW